MSGQTPRWLPASEVPWGVQVLDVRPVTLGMLSTSHDPQVARDAISYHGEDGSSFAQQLPKVAHAWAMRRRYRVQGRLYDGALFVPDCMEHKWAIFVRQGRLIFVRSWLREVVAVADYEPSGPDQITVTMLHGDFGAGALEAGQPQLNERVLDFLLRAYGLGQVYPAPLPASIAQGDPRVAGLWCMTLFGKMAWVASAQEPEAQEPEVQAPLRTLSLMHLAAVRGDAAQVRALLERGWPATLLAHDGLTLMHWAAACEHVDMLAALVELGVPVDVPSQEGATALMNAVQRDDLALVERLLALGADVDARDARGFTSLHRAAEMGHVALVERLLRAGASAEAQAQGHTARSLAQLTQQAQIVALLDSRG